MDHSFDTRHGYSGSPIIVQLISHSPDSQYLIAIHSAANGSLKFSTKMNDVVIERLIGFEQRLLGQ